MITASVKGTMKLGGEPLRMRVTQALVEAAAELHPILQRELRNAAPRARIEGGKFASSIQVFRYTTLVPIPLVGLKATSKVYYAPYIIHGTQPHTIRSAWKRSLHWTTDSGDEMYATLVHHPGTRPNTFAIDTGTRQRFAYKRMVASRLHNLGLGMK